jgi:hypothetical protein
MNTPLYTSPKGETIQLPFSRIATYPRKDNLLDNLIAAHRAGGRASRGCVPPPRNAASSRLYVGNFARCGPAKRLRVPRYLGCLPKVLENVQSSSRHFENHATNRFQANHHYHSSSLHDVVMLSAEFTRTLPRAMILFRLCSLPPNVTRLLCFTAWAQRLGRKRRPGVRQLGPQRARALVR